MFLEPPKHNFENLMLLIAALYKVRAIFWHAKQLLFRPY